MEQFDLRLPLHGFNVRTRKRSRSIDRNGAQCGKDVRLLVLLVTFTPKIRHTSGIGLRGISRQADQSRCIYLSVSDISVRYGSLLEGAGAEPSSAGTASMTMPRDVTQDVQTSRRHRSLHVYGRMRSAAAMSRLLRRKNVLKSRPA